MDKEHLKLIIKNLPFTKENFELLKEELIKSTFPGFHLDTIEDLLKLIDTCYELFPYNRDNKVLITSEKLDELKHYTLKLKSYITIPEQV